MFYEAFNRFLKAFSIETLILSINSYHNTLLIICDPTRQQREDLVETGKEEDEGRQAANSSSPSHLATQP